MKNAKEYVRILFFFIDKFYGKKKLEMQFNIKEEYEAKRKELLRKCDERIAKNK